MKKKIINLFTVFLLPTFLASCSPTNTEPNLVRIQANGNEVLEYNLFVDDTLQLKAKLEPAESKAKIKWLSSLPDVAQVSDNGLVKAISKGTSIISCICPDYSYIKREIFINVTDKVEQKGVGSGLTENDPIFLGNEGSNEIEVHFLEDQNIYSDSLFIKKGNMEVLIDAGYENDGKYISNFLKANMPDNRLDLLVVTHGDGDHINGIENAIKDVKDISLMIDYGGAEQTTAKARMKEREESGTKYYTAYDCVNHLNGAFKTIYLTKDVYINVLNTGNYLTDDDTSQGSNPHSVALIFNYKNFKFFTAGDLTKDAESDLVSNENLPQVTLYKASHHGSTGSNYETLLNQINPKAVAISAARASNYKSSYNETYIPKENETYNLDMKSGHPHKDAIERIYKAPRISENLNVYWNAINGDMTFKSKGDDNFTFIGSATRKGYYDLTLTNNTPIWDTNTQDFKNRITGEENLKLHQSKAFTFRNYVDCLPTWAQYEYFPSN